MGSPAPTHVSLRNSPRDSPPGAPSLRNASGGSGGSGGSRNTSGSSVQFTGHGQAYATDNRGRVVPNQRFIEVAEDVLQSDANGTKITVRIGARVVRRNHDPNSNLEIRYSYLGVPPSALEWAPAPPIPDDETRNDIAHNVATGGLRWLPAYTIPSRAPGAEIASMPNNAASRFRLIIYHWIQQFVIGNPNPTSFDYA